MSKSRGMLHDIYCHLLWCVNEKSARGAPCPPTIPRLNLAQLAGRGMPHLRMQQKKRCEMHFAPTTVLDAGRRDAIAGSPVSNFGPRPCATRRTTEFPAPLP